MMRLSGILLAVLCLASPARSQHTREAAVREAVRQYVEAREHIDAKATESLFTADADQLVSTGEWRKGRDAVVSGTVASSRRSTGTRTITVESVRFLTAAVAIADGRYEIAASASSPARRMWTTIVLVRQRGVWRISAIRNMLPAPAR